MLSPGAVLPLVTPLTLNDLERRNGLILRYFAELGRFQGPLRKSD